MFKKVLQKLKQKKVILPLVSAILVVLVNYEVIEIGVSEEIMKIVNILVSLFV